jgi:hypothetical protein
MQSQSLVSSPNCRRKTAQFDDARSALVLHFASTMVHRQRALQPTTASDSLYRVLDGHVITRRGRQWRLTVCGIFADSTHRWVQLRLTGTSEYLLTIRLAVTDTGSDYYTAVADWLDRAAHSDLAIISCAEVLGSISDGSTKPLHLLR